MKGLKRLAAIAAVCSLLVAVLFFPAAPAVACNAVGGGVPAFSFTAPQVYGGYGAQSFVQADTYGSCGAVQQFVQPVYAQSYVQQPFLGVSVGGYGVGVGLGYNQAFRQRVIIPQRVVVRPHIRQRVVVAGY
jgi:hypothetical protein